MRFQPIMVPRPSAIATATFTHTGMNLVSLSMCVFSEAADFCSSGSSSLWAFNNFPSASDVRYKSLRNSERCGLVSSERLVLPLRVSEISLHLVPIAP